MRRAWVRGVRGPRVLAVLAVTLLLTSAAGCGRDEIDARAELLVRRNLFEGSLEHSIRNVRAHSYGDLEVDGLEGGMMYRFEAERAAIDWLVVRWSLQRVAPETLARSIPQSVPEGPSWWLPRGTEGLAIYRRKFVDRYDSEHTLVLLHRAESDLVYFLEHILASSGV